jgi:prepilin-type N-terminal cleavage/methylation domain-containing protein
MSRDRNNRGFTLIEILIALAMMVTIVSMVYGSYAATSKSAQAYSSRLDYTGRAGQILRLMARQIRCVYVAPADLQKAESSGKLNAAQDVGGSALKIDTPAERQSPSFSGNAGGLHGELLDFVTTAGLGSGAQGSSGLSRIRYRHDATTGTLWLDCQPHMDRPHRTDLQHTGHPVLDHVTAVNVEFYDGRKWAGTWNGKKRNDVPRAVRISLKLVDDEDRSYQFGTTIRVQSQTVAPMTVSERRTGRGRR